MYGANTIVVDALGPDIIGADTTGSYKIGAKTYGPDTIE